MSSRSGRQRSDDQFRLNLTPLLDVVLQLITFFMLLIHFGTKLEGSSQEIKLAVTPAALPGKDLTLDRLTVVLDRRGRLLVDDKAIEGDAADAWWTEQARTRRVGMESLGGPAADLPTAVVVRADRQASYGSVRRTLARAQDLGFAHFSLVTVRNPQP